MISSVFGGVLVLREMGETRIKDVEVSYMKKKKVSRLWITKQLLHPVITYLTLMSFPINYLGKLFHFVFKKIGLINNATSKKEKNFRKPQWIDKAYPPVLLSLAKKQLDDFVKSQRTRSRYAKLYQKASIPSIQKDSNKERVWLRYPIVVENPDKYHEKFKSEGIIIGDWYNQVIGPRGVSLQGAHYNSGDAPVAEKVSKQIINLPLYPRMTKEEVEKVIRVYKSINNDGN